MPDYNFPENKDILSDKSYKKIHRVLVTPTWFEYVPTQDNLDANEINSPVNLQNSSFSEDKNFTAWLKNLGINPRNEIQNFFSKVFEKYAHLDELGELINATKNYYELKEQFNSDNSATFTQEKYAKTTDLLNKLTEDTPERLSFANAIQRFNVATNFEYADTNEIKYLYMLEKHTDFIAGEIERENIVLHNSEVDSRTKDITSLNNLIDNHYSVYEKFSDTFAEEALQKIPDIKIADYNDALSAFTQKSEELGKTLEAQKKEIIEFETSLNADIREYETLSENKTISDKKIADGYVNTVKAQVAGLEEMETLSAMKNKRANFISAIDNMNKQVADIKDFPQKLQTYREFLAFSDTVKDIDKASVNELKTLLSDNKNFAEQFVKFFDAAYPKGKTVTSFFGFRSKQLTGKDMLEDLKKNPKKIAGELEDIKRELGRNKVASYHKNYEIQRNAIVEENARKDVPVGEEIKHLDGRIATWSNFIKQAQDAANRIKTGASEEHQNNISLSDNKQALEQKINEKKPILKKLKEEYEKNLNMKNIADEKAAVIKKYNEYSADFNKGRQEINDIIGNYIVNTAPIPPFGNQRNERIKKRIDGFIARIDENRRRLHGDSTEYTNFVNALRAVRDGGAENYKENIEKLQKTAINYIHQKGSDGIFKRGPMGVSRLNLAKEVQGWCENLEYDFAKPVKNVPTEQANLEKAWRGELPNEPNSKIKTFEEIISAKIENKRQKAQEAKKQELVNQADKKLENSAGKNNPELKGGVIHN